MTHRPPDRAGQDGERAAAISTNPPNVVAGWDEAHRYSPAPRHRRRLVVRLVRGLGAVDCLDAGCGQPFLLADLREKLGLRCYGCDISDAVMHDAAAQRMAEELRVLDLQGEVWPDGRQFDVVVCSEVLEHLEDWRPAVANLVHMARRHVLITVPGGKLRAMDRLVGHHRHFAPSEIADELRAHGCEPLVVRRWGFPLHSAYRWAISRFDAERMYERYSGEAHPYTPAQRRFSDLLTGLFYVNDLFGRGDQVIVLARRGGA
jgi:SAM-dependent methyltransferase